MRIIGITGGAGAGKTLLMTYIKERYACRILLADEVAKAQQQPGEVCYEQIVNLLGKDIIGLDGTIIPSKMAERIFRDKELLKAVNTIVHPAVKQYIMEEIREEREFVACELKKYGVKVD